MADGEINRNGATIRIDDDGGVQVEPAEGQEVEYTGPDRGTDAIRDSVNTKDLTNNYHYAGAYDGADADARLDAALSSASDGDLIYLESSTYSTDRTISGRVRIVGTNGVFLGSEIDATWTCDSRVAFENIACKGIIVLNVRQSRVVNSIFGGVSEILVQNDKAVIHGINGFDADVVFSSETAQGIVDSSTNINVVDNGNNTVGDIA